MAENIVAVLLKFQEQGAEQLKNSVKQVQSSLAGLSATSASLALRTGKALPGFTQQMLVLKAMGASGDVAAASLYKLGQGQNVFGQIFNQNSKNALASMLSNKTSYMQTSAALRGELGNLQVVANSTTGELSNLATIPGAKFRIMGHVFAQEQSRLAQGMLNTGKQAQWVGRQMLVGMTLPMAAVAAKSNALYLELARQQTELQKYYAQAGISGAKFATLLDGTLAPAFKSLSTQLGIHQADITQISSLWAAAGKTLPSLNMGLTTLTAKLATVTQGDLTLESSFELVRTIQNTYNLSLADTTSELEKLQAIQSATAITYQELGAAIPLVANSARVLGIDVAGVAAALAGMRQQGISANQAANALKYGLGRLIAPTKTAADAFKNFSGKSLESINFDKTGTPKGIKGLEDLASYFQAGTKGILKESQSSVLATMFGNRQLPRMIALFNSINNKQSDFQKSLAVSSDKVKAHQLFEEQLNIVLSGMSKKWDILKTSLENAGIAFGKLIGPKLQSLFNFVTRLVDGFNKMSDASKNLVVDILSVGAALGPLTFITGQVFLAMGRLRQIFVAGPLKLLFSMKSVEDPLGLQRLAQQTRNPQLQVLAGMPTLNREITATSAEVAAAQQAITEAWLAESGAVDILTGSIEGLNAAQAGLLDTQSLLSLRSVASRINPAQEATLTGILGAEASSPLGISNPLVKRKLVQDIIRAPESVATYTPEQLASLGSVLTAPAPYRFAKPVTGASGTGSIKDAIRRMAVTGQEIPLQSLQGIGALPQLNQLLAPGAVGLQESIAKLEQAGLNVPKQDIYSKIAAEISSYGAVNTTSGRLPITTLGVGAKTHLTTQEFMQQLYRTVGPDIDKVLAQVEPSVQKQIIATLASDIGLVGGAAIPTILASPTVPGLVQDRAGRYRAAAGGFTHPITGETVPGGRFVAGAEQLVAPQAIATGQAEVAKTLESQYGKTLAEGAMAQKFATGIEKTATEATDKAATSPSVLTKFKTMVGGWFGRGGAQASKAAEGAIAGAAIKGAEDQSSNSKIRTSIENKLSTIWKSVKTPPTIQAIAPSTGEKGFSSYLLQFKNFIPIIAIASLAILVLGKNWKSLWAGMGDYVNRAIKTISDALGNLVRYVVNAFTGSKSTVESNGDAFRALGEIIGHALLTASRVIAGLINLIGPTLTKAIEIAINAAKVFIGIFTGSWHTIVDGATSFVGILGRIAAIAGAAWLAFKGFKIIQTVIATLRGLNTAYAASGSIIKAFTTVQAASNTQEGIAALAALRTKVATLSAAQADALKTGTLAEQTLATEALTAAQLELADAEAAATVLNPWLLLAVAIGAVIAALTIFGGKASAIQRAVDDSINSVMDTFRTFRDEIQKTGDDIKTFGTDAVTAMTSVLESINKVSDAMQPEAFGIRQLAPAIQARVNAAQGPPNPAIGNLQTSRGGGRLDTTKIFAQADQQALDFKNYISLIFKDVILPDLSGLNYDQYLKQIDVWQKKIHSNWQEIKLDTDIIDVLTAKQNKLRAAGQDLSQPEKDFLAANIKIVAELTGQNQALSSWVESLQNSDVAAQALAGHFSSMADKFHGMAGDAQATAKTLKATSDDFKNEFANQLSSLLGDLTSSVTDQFDKMAQNRTDAFDKMAAQRLGYYDKQIAEINKVNTKEQWLQQQRDYRRQREQMLEQAALNGAIAYREKLKAITEGRFDDARLIDLQALADQRKSQADIENLDQQHHKTVKDHQDQAKIDQLNKQKTALQKQLDAQKTALQKQLDAQRTLLSNMLKELTEFAPKNAREWRKMYGQIQQFAAEHGIAMTAVAANFTKTYGRTINQGLADASKDAEEFALANATGLGKDTTAALQNQMSGTVSPADKKFFNIIGDFAQAQADAAKSGHPMTGGQLASWMSKIVAAEGGVSKSAQRAGDESGLTSGPASYKSPALFPSSPLYHSGGEIGGSPRRDVPIIAQEGEFIFRRDVVKKLGVDFLHRINNAKEYHYGGIVDSQQTYHSGGPVQNDYSTVINQISNNMQKYHEGGGIEALAPVNTYHVGGEVSPYKTIFETIKPNVQKFHAGGIVREAIGTIMNNITGARSVEKMVPLQVAANTIRASAAQTVKVVAKSVARNVIGQIRLQQQAIAGRQVAAAAGGGPTVAPPTGRGAFSGPFTYPALEAKLTGAIARIHGTPAENKFQAAAQATFRGLVNLGVYNRRFIAGTSEWSQHAWGNAVDLATNPFNFASMDKMALWAKSNFNKFNIAHILWRYPGHYNHMHTDFYPQGTGTPPVLHEGGEVPAAQGQSDVSIIAQPGEFVFKRSMVKKIGTQMLHNINNGKHSLAKEYHAGGLINILSSKYHDGGNINLSRTKNVSIKSNMHKYHDGGNINLSPTKSVSIASNMHKYHSGGNINLSPTKFVSIANNMKKYHDGGNINLSKTKSVMIKSNMHKYHMGGMIAPTYEPFPASTYHEGGLILREKIATLNNMKFQAPSEYRENTLVKNLTNSLSKISQNNGDINIEVNIKGDMYGDASSYRKLHQTLEDVGRKINQERGKSNNVKINIGGG